MLRLRTAAQVKPARSCRSPDIALLLAVPKGRILAEALPLLARAGIVPEAAFGDEDSRALRFATDDPALGLIRVRAFDVATFVAHGAAQLGIVGSDVLAEFDYPALYAPVDLGIGRCRLSVAMPADADRERRRPRPGRDQISQPHRPPFRRARRAGGMHQAERRDGAGAAARPRTADRRSGVSSGRTLAENGLVEVEPVLDVTARLIVNRAAFKTRPELVELVERFRAAVA